METVTVPHDDWKLLVTSVADINTALAGSHVLGTKGVIWEVQKLKEQMVDQQQKEQTRKGIMWAFGIIWSGALVIGGFLIDIFYGKK